MACSVRFGAASLTFVAVLASCDPGLSDLTSGDPAPPAKLAGAADGGSTGADGSASGTGIDGSTGVADGDGGDGDGDGGGTSCGPIDSGAHENGSFCKQGSDCCSGACSESHRCIAACIPEAAGGCDPQGSTCCAGDYCSVNAGTKCEPCIADGNPPEQVGGVNNDRSCCSRQTGAFDGGPVHCRSSD